MLVKRITIQENWSITIKLKVMFSSWEENYSSTLIFSHLSVGLQEPWIFSTRDSNNLATENGIFFPPRWYSTSCDSGYSLHPPSLCIVACVLLPLALREPLSIVRKYKRRSLEVQVSVVALWVFWSTQRLSEKWNISKENVLPN